MHLRLRHILVVAPILGAASCKSKTESAGDHKPTKAEEAPSKADAFTHSFVEIDRLAIEHASAFRVADFNGDARSDVLTGYELILANADGKLVERTSLPCDPPKPRLTYDPTVEAWPIDADGTGNLDILLSLIPQNLYHGCLIANRPPLEVLQKNALKWTQKGYYVRAAVADVNGDGRDDVLELKTDEETSHGMIDVRLNVSSERLAAPTEFYNPNRRMQWLRAVDLNGDGRDEVLAAWFDSSPFLVRLDYGDDGKVTPTVLIDKAVNALDAIPGDFDGDGHVDLVVRGSVKLYMMYGKADGSFEAPIVIDEGLGQLLSAAIATDANGDGHTDLLGSAVWRADNSYGLVILFGMGKRTFADPWQQKIPKSKSISFGDVNGDGRIDAFVGFPETGELAVYASAQ